MEIAELKSRLGILEVAGRLGIRVDKHGKAHCPFHDDKTPSLQFSQEKNIATCFSSRCSVGTMDIIGLTEKYLKVSTHEAIMQLKEWIGLPAETVPPLKLHATRGSVKAGQEPKEPPAHLEPSEGDKLERIAILTKAFRYYENGIKTSRKGKDYLQSRGLTQATIGKTGIEVGFNSGNFTRSKGDTAPNQHLQATALKYGLLYKRSKSGYGVFGRDSLVFPLKDKDHKIVSLYYRSIIEIARTQSSGHYYLKDRQGLYPGYPKPATTQLILTESIIDAATLLQLPGIQDYQVLACYGTNGLTDEHLSAIASAKALTEITFFFDGDEAGATGVKKQAEKLKGLIPEIKLYQVDTPENEDVSSLYVSHQDQAEELFKHLLNARLPLGTGRKPLEKEATELVIPAPTEPTDQINSQVAQPKPGEEKSASRADKFDTSNPNKITYFTDPKAGTGARYYVKGGLRQELDRLQVSLMIESNQQQTYGRYRNRLDLYENKQVERLAREAGEKLGLREDLIALELYKLTDELEDYRDSQISDSTAPPRKTLDHKTSSQCQAFLSQPNLIQRINELIGKAGVIGEDDNRVFLFCIAASCGMPDTLHALIQGSSGSGKTHLLVKISSFIPDEGVKRFTRVTESSFYNYGMYELKNKLICLEDLDGMKEEAQLAFRELQSRAMLTSSTTGQDEKGNNRAYEKTVHGPIASMACTTKGEIYEDNMNRCFLIAVDETQEQTQRIIQYQNCLAAGAINKEEQKQVTTFLQNCIRLLKPYEVINPYADKVQLPQEAHKIRRLNDLYQSFVKQITLMNQYRRKRDQKGRLITEKEDLQVAAAIMFDSIVLKVDELDGSLRLFYEELKGYIKGKGNAYESYSFGQREIRQALHISKSQLQRYMHDLLSLEYIHMAGGHINKGYRYKIAYWDDVAKLKGKVKRHLQGQLDQLEINIDQKTSTLPAKSIKHPKVINHPAGVTQ